MKNFDSSLFPLAFACNRNNAIAVAKTTGRNTLLLFGLLAMFSTSKAFAADLYVKSGGGCVGVPCYTTLNLAIIAASAGDVIHLEADITEALVTVNKVVTIDGHGFKLTSTSGTFGIYFAAASAGATLQNIIVDDAGTFGVATDPGADNLTLSNVTVQNCTGTGFALACIDGATLTNITATNNGGNGLSLTNVTNMTINGLTTSGNTFGAFSAGIGVFTTALYCPPGVTNGLALSGTISIAEPIKAYSQKTVASQTIANLSGGPFAYAVQTDALTRSYWPTKADAYAAAAAGMDAPYNYSNANVCIEELSTGDYFVDDNPNSDATPPMRIQAAMDNVVAGNTVFVEAGTYAERVSITKSVTLDGAGMASTFLNGSGLVGMGSGISISNNVTNVTIQDLRVQNYALGGSNDAGIAALLSNNNLTVKNCEVDNNAGGRGGVYVNGPVNTVMIDGVKSHDHPSGSRGIVVWNGFKQNITIQNCEVYNNNCCGIELQDGTASGVTIQNNNVHDNWDNGLGITGLTSGAGPNLIFQNTVEDNGRFGIEIKLPNGTGATSGDGSILVDDNDVTITSSFVGQRPSEERDIAGIAVFRRAYNVSENNADIPTGVVVRNNTVSGYVQDNGASSSEGFGIVAEGTNHDINNNMVSGCDIGIQRQAGHSPYTANTATDGDQSDLADEYFGRGNSPVACGIDISGNTLSNTIDTRDVPMSIATGGSVYNTTSGETFCTIQAAINDANTLTGHTLEVYSGTFNEQVLVTKGVNIKGVGATQPLVDFTGTVTGKPTLFDVSVDGVTIDNIHFNVDMSKLRSAIIASAAGLDNITVKNNVIDAYGTPAGSYGDRNAVSVNYGGSTNYRVATGGVNNVVFQNNTVNGSMPGSYFRSGISLDEGGGTFTGNTLQTINHDILVRFAGNGAVTLSNNNLNGGGVELSDQNAAGSPITVSNNTFNGVFANLALLRGRPSYGSKTTTTALSTISVPIPSTVLNGRYRWKT